MRATLRHRVTDLWRRSLRRRSLKDWAFIIVLFVVLGLVAYKSFFAVPSRQDELVNALTSFRSQYQSASGNDLQRNQIRDARNRFLCTFINGAPQVRDWVGHVKQISQEKLLGVVPTPAYGLVVTIGDDITVETYGGALAEKDQAERGTPTNIREGSPMFSALARLKAGDRVVFSGEFITETYDMINKKWVQGNCVRERSITTSGSFRAPQLLFRFTSIEAR